MAVKTQTLARATDIRPFTVEIPESDLQELRQRIAATRWPEKQTVDDQSQGVPLETSQALARYWEKEYDWRKVEARLNSLPNFITEIVPASRWWKAEDYHQDYLEKHPGGYTCHFLRP